MNVESLSSPHTSVQDAPPTIPARRNWLGAAVALIVGVVLGFLMGRRAGVTPPPSVAPVRSATAQASARRVQMTALLRTRAGIETAVIQRRTLVPSLDVMGSVAFDGNHMAHVGSRVAGRVTRLVATIGQTVQSGDALAEIESAEVSEALASYVAAQAGVTAARAEGARLERLTAQHLATAREVEQQRVQRAGYEATLRGSLQRLMASGLSLGEVQGLIRSPRAARITLRAPIAGHVVARDVVLGQVIEPTTTAFQIADPARVWVLLEVFERDLARVAVGDSAELETDAQPGLRHRGHVMHIATSVDDSTRTARVRIEVENPDGALRPGQFVRARLRAGEAAGRAVVAVPRGAVVQVEGRPAAFVAVSEGEFELRTLELGVADGDDLEVLRGVDAGEVLVVRGSFALKSELLR